MLLEPLMIGLAKSEAVMELDGVFPQAEIPTTEIDPLEKDAAKTT
jgi:hypothetical protein